MPADAAAHVALIEAFCAAPEIMGSGPVFRQRNHGVRSNFPRRVGPFARRAAGKLDLIP